MKRLIIFLIFLGSKQAMSQIFVQTTQIDVFLQLPMNSITVTSSGSSKYLWTKLSGPAGGTIQSPTTAKTIISGFNAGTYSYKLVTASRTDTLRVQVLSIAPPQTALEYPLTSTTGVITVFQEQPDGTLKKKN